jgi:hypothetical protein
MRSNATKSAPNGSEIGIFRVHLQGHNQKGGCIMKILPIGTQSFSVLRNTGCLYVDKTEDIYRMISLGRVYFLARPRRFGKSLLISTLDALFRCRKELFEGLYIADKWDWEGACPVVRLDFTTLNFSNSEELKWSLNSFLDTIASNYQLSLQDNPLSVKFYLLIKTLHETTGRPVVFLVDEYDKPITDYLTDAEAMKANQKVLHDFYQVLKGADEHIRFIFMTGISKFSGLAIFSSLNNLSDITLHEDYATICGYTQAELESNFSDYMDNAGRRLNMSREELLTGIRTMYNGYSWDGATSVYNPFSTMLFFYNRQFDTYWFRTGTPTFLIDMLKSRNRIEPILKPITTGVDTFNSYDPLHIGEIPLLFQTGYLTIKGKTREGYKNKYTLDLPNMEVRDAFTTYLLNAYCDYSLEEMRPLLSEMQQQLRDADADAFEQSLRLLLAHVPYEIHVASEAYYHSMFLLLMKMLGFDIEGQIMTNLGRIDAVWRQPGLTVVAEIKYGAAKRTNSLLNAAMKQIRDRRYYEKYADRDVLLLGIAFTGKEVKCCLELRIKN